MDNDSCFGGGSPLEIYNNTQMPIIALLTDLRQLDMNKDLIKNEALRKVIDAYITKCSNDMMNVINELFVDKKAQD